MVGWVHQAQLGNALSDHYANCYSWVLDGDGQPTAGDHLGRGLTLPIGVSDVTALAVCAAGQYVGPCNGNAGTPDEFEVEDVAPACIGSAATTGLSSAIRRASAIGSL